MVCAISRWSLVANWWVWTVFVRSQTVAVQDRQMGRENIEEA